MKAQAFALAALAVVAGSAIAHGDPIPSFTRAQSPLVKVNSSTVGIQASSSAQAGFMSAMQASDLAFVLAGGMPTPTPVVLDPLNFTHGRIQSEGVPLTYMSDTFIRADTANITGTPIETGGVNWQAASFGGFVAFTIGVQTDAAVCTNPFCNGGGGRGLTAEYVDTSRSDEAVSVDTTFGSVVQRSLFYVRMNSAATSGWVAYDAAFAGANHLCLEGFGAGAPGQTCGAGFGAIGATTATLSLDGNTLSLTLSTTPAASVSVSSSFQNTGTRAGLGWGQNGDGPESYTNFVVSAPLLPIGLSVRGDYTNGTHATITLGETFNGIDFDIPDNTGNFTFHDSTVLDSSLAVAGASTLHATAVTTLAASSTVTGTQLVSTIATGTAPATSASTTLVANWNADLLDGLDSTAFALAGTSPTKACAATLSLAWGTVATLDTVRFTGQTCTGAVVGDECSVSVDTALPTGAVLFAQGDGSDTVLVEAGCIKSTGCTFAAQITRVICVHH